MEVIKHKNNKEQDNGLQQLIEEIKNIERLLEINRRTYNDIEDSNLIEANIYEYRGLMIRYNYMLSLIREASTKLTEIGQFPPAVQKTVYDRLEETV